jgi:hypothetical protein
MTGSKVVAGIALLPIVVIVGGIGGCEARKAYFDWQVRKLCEKEGGVTVYEHYRPSNETLKALGGETTLSSLPDKSLQRFDIPVYQHLLESVARREGSPTIARHEAIVARWSDSKVLGRLVIFSRAGGDFPFSGSAPSYFQCPAVNTDLVRQVLAPQGGTN